MKPIIKKLMEASESFAEESPTITLAKGGTGERKVKLAALEIPDLWYADDGTGRIIETWHIAHDLKRELHELFVQRDELLAVLKACDEYWSNGTPVYSHSFVAQAAQAEIAKAEGRAQ